MTDIFSEVEEDLRNELLKSAWNRYGIVLIGLAILLVLVVAGFKGYEWWQASTSARDGDRFIRAIEQADTGKHQAARQALLELAETGSPGYSVVARFRAATEAANVDDIQGAIQTFRGLAADPEVPEDYRQLAELRAAYLAVDSESYSDLVSRIGTRAEGGDWVLQAKEVLGLAAFKEGDLRTARDFFDDILDDPAAGRGLLERARVISGVIRGRIGSATEADGLASETDQ